MEGKLPYVVGGACALITGALLYHWYSSSEAEEEEKYSALYNELNEMGQVQKDASGIVVLDDFLKIFKTVTKHAKDQISNFKAETTVKRRQHLKEGDDEAYKECIKKQINQEENIYQDVANEVLNHFGIEEQEFIMAQNMHAMNPQFQKIMMEMQLGVKEGDNTPPSITKEQAKEAFIFVEEEKAKEMGNVKGGAMGMMGGQDPESQINMIVAHSKVGDKLFEKFGVEEEEFAKSIQYHNLLQDPEIQKLMQKSLQGLGPEALSMLAQMQGAAPGGPGGAPGGMAGGMPGGMGF